MDGTDAWQAREFLGSYQLLEEIGHGSTAHVFRARHVHPRHAEEAYAVKVISKNWAQNPGTRKLFRAEGFLSSQLLHTNIVHTAEAGIADDLPYIAMELIDGCCLGAVLDRVGSTKKRIPPSLALHILGEALGGLAFAHSLRDENGRRIGVVHRDLKPNNVFLSFDGQVKLGDFGVAVYAGDETHTAPAGTPGYYAPEQMELGPVYPAADIYACGVIMYELLCGAHPFMASTRTEVMRRNRRGKFVDPREINPELDPALAAIIIKALQKKPKKRFADAAEMRMAFSPFLGRDGMQLGVASWLRDLFLPEHVHAEKMRFGLAAQPESQRPHVLGIWSEPNWQREIGQMLAQRGFHVHAINDADAVGHNLGALLLDLRQSVGIRERALTLGERGIELPLLVLTDTLDDAAIKLSHQLGAVDILAAPVQPERLHTAVWTALSNQPHHDSLEEEEKQIRTPLLVVAAPPMVEELRTIMRKAPYVLHGCDSAAALLAFLAERSPRALLCDVPRGKAAGAHQLAEAVRDRRGVGLLPIVFLAEEDDHTNFADIPRSAVRLRRDPAVVLVATLRRLCADKRWGRSYVRYPATLSVEMTYRGRAFVGQSVNISRGSLMFRCVETPTMGALAKIGIRLDDKTHIIADVRITRVSPAGEELTNIAAEFSSFSGASERMLIDYVDRLQVG